MPRWRSSTRPAPTFVPARRRRPQRARNHRRVAADPGLPQIVGLDVRSGLHYAGGKVSFYSQLLRQFACDFSVFAGAFGSDLNAGNWDDAARQAHTLKGLAASLGAIELQPRAAALELAARARDMTQARDNLAQTIERLAPLLSALRLHYGVDDVVDSQVRIGACCKPRQTARRVRPPSSPHGGDTSVIFCSKRTWRPGSFGNRGPERSMPGCPRTWRTASRWHSRISNSTRPWACYRKIPRRRDQRPMEALQLQVEVARNQ